MFDDEFRSFVIPGGAGWVITYRTVGFLISHQVDYEGGGADEEDLHESVVQTDVVHEQVQVAHTEDDQIHFLSLARQTYKTR
jgi:hypothetical protein